MKKILQKAGAFICCCLVCFQLMIQPAHAVAVADDLLFGVLASLAITSGVTFTAIETFDPVVTAIKDKMNENGITDEDIQGYISDGTRLVYDVGEYAWKAVVDVPDALWWGVQQAVSALYNPGTIPIMDDGAIDSAAATTIYNSSFSNSYDLIANNVSQIQSYDGYVYNAQLLISGNMLTVNWFRTTTGLLDSTRSWTFNSTASIYLNRYSNDYYSFGLKIDGGDLGIWIPDCQMIQVLSSTSYGNITAAATVDQEDYDWANENTDTKVIEFPSTYKGDPDSDDEDEKKLVLWPDIEKYLQGKDASDITSEDTSGIEDPAAQAQADPSEAVTDYTDPPAAGSESNTSLKGLLFTKFPFCIPWDIKNAFTLLVAPATPPEWEIDLVPQSIKARAHITADTTWHITMDGLEVVGTVTRWTSTIGFCLALAVATRKLIRA